MSPGAPFHAHLADGPEAAESHWVTAADGVRLRAVLWPGGDRGTVLMFTGRSEYAEKYGRIARDLAAMGLATATVDWRGQGLADRALADPRTGHVGTFADYQLDVQALLRLASERDLAEPYFLIGHSMGGCIGLRAVYEGLPVRSAVFTAPMWGIQMGPAVRMRAWGTSWLARALGQGHRYVPGTDAGIYLEKAPFADNLLTTDEDHYSYMRRQVTEVPDLSLGGPSLHWLYEALVETRALMRRPAPDLPCVTFLGSRERVVDTEAIHRRMRTWPKGRLVIIENGEHEVLMETAEIRARILSDLRQAFLNEGD